MGDDVRVWLVERSYTDGGIVALVYATPEGGRVWRRQRSPAALDGGVRASRTVAPERLDTVADETVRERYAAEAARVAERNARDDRV